MINQIICPDAIPGFLNFFDFSIAPTLLFYSYIPIIVVSLILSIFVLFKDKFSLLSKLLLLITISFSVWALDQIVQWTAVYASTVHFSWQIIALFEMLVFIFALYFVAVFLYKKDINFGYKFLLGLAFLPIIVFLPTKLNITSFDLQQCQSNFSFLWYYIYIFEVLSIAIMVYMFNSKFRSLAKDDPFRKQVAILGIGMFLFLGMFTATNILGDLILVYEINLIGPIGMVAFFGLMTFMIVKFKTFNIKLLATQALVWGLAVLIGSQFFFIKAPTNFVLNSITFIGIIVFGWSLIKSVKKEVKAREEIQRLAIELEESNDKLGQANERLTELDKQKSEFVSIASHQLRSPLTAIKGYSSMLLEGSFGEMNDKAKEAIDKIFQSSQRLVVIIENFLNLSRIEQGRMQYEFTTLELRKVTEDVIKSMEATVKEAGLSTEFKNDGGEYNITADDGKIRQVITNIIDNAIKYTHKGGITVKISKDDYTRKIMLEISDTGIGIPPEVMPRLFEKFSRAEEASKANIMGTGLGLYVAKQIILAHRGNIWVDSEGVGKGSTFYLEFMAE